MNIRERHFGPCVSATSPDGEVTLDVATFVERLLLFDKYIVLSHRFKEIPALIRLFGYESVLRLLKSKALSIYCDTVTIAQTGQVTVGGRDKSQLLPLQSFSFQVVRAADHQDLIHGALRELDDKVGVTGKRLTRLKLAIAEILIPQCADDGLGALRQLETDLTSNVPQLRTAAALATNKQLVTVPAQELTLGIERLNDHDFRVVSNLAGLTGASPEQVHKVLQSGILAVGGLNLVLEWMQTHSAVTGLRPSELSIFESKLSFLANELDPEAQHRRFNRILQLSDFPDVGESLSEGRLNMDRLLEIRETESCRQFRRWLRGTASASDEEIINEFRSLSATLAPYAQGKTGKVLRWAAGTAVGLVPGAGALLGPALGLLDTFLIEKVLPKAGPTTFISDLYPSIFKDK